MKQHIKLNSKEIKQMDILRQVRLQSFSDEKEMVGVHINTGENAGNGLRYISGNAPTENNEIVLSYLMSKELNKSIGDEVEIIANGKTEKFKISGIYQDITSGGKTAKTIRAFLDIEAEKYTYGIRLSDNGKISEITNELKKRLGSGYVIENMEEFLEQTFGSVTTQAKSVSTTVFLIVIFISGLIIMLFIKLLLVKDGSALALKKALGISYASIIKQELYPILISGGIGSLTGVVLVEVFGDEIISILFSTLGIGLKEFIFADVKIWQLFTLPIILIIVLATVSICILVKIKKLDVMRYVNE